MLPRKPKERNGTAGVCPPGCTVRWRSLARAEYSTRRDHPNLSRQRIREPCVDGSGDSIAIQSRSWTRPEGSCRSCFAYKTPSICSSCFRDPPSGRTLSLRGTEYTMTKAVLDQVARRCFLAPFFLKVRRLI